MSVSSIYFFFSSRRRHTRLQGDWSSDVCSSDLARSCASHPLARLPGRGWRAPACGPAIPHATPHALEYLPVGAVEAVGDAEYTAQRSEERRVGKECQRRRETSVDERVNSRQYDA